MSDDTEVEGYKRVRDPAYSARLIQACDASPHCPPLHGGRLSWIVQELGRRDVKVRSQTVKYWLDGIMRPRHGKSAILAEILGVDPIWLFHGVENERDKGQRRVRDAQADGVVNVIAGFIRMDGGVPAFPLDDDKRAARDRIDLYAVIKGANYSFRVVLAESTKDGWSFDTTLLLDDVIVLGVVREGMCIRVVEISASSTADWTQSAAARGARVVATSKQVDAAAIESFTARL